MDLPAEVDLRLGTRPAETGRDGGTLRPGDANLQEKGKKFRVIEPPVGLMLLPL